MSKFSKLEASKLSHLSAITGGETDCNSTSQTTGKQDLVTSTRVPAEDGSRTATTKFDIGDCK